MAARTSRPREVEEVLLRHPSVADAVCFGIPDEKYGEQVAAAVSLSAEADDAGPDRLLPRTSHQRSRCRTSIHVLDAIPRTPTGKLQRRRIAAAISASSR